MREKEKVLLLLVSVQRKALVTLFMELEKEVTLIGVLRTDAQQ